MALITKAEWYAFTGTTLTGAADTAAAAVVAQVNAAITRLCKPTVFEADDDFVFKPIAAPNAQTLILPARPVRAVVSIHYNPAANGDPALLTDAAYLIDPSGYFLEIDDHEAELSRKGFVTRRGSGWATWNGGAPGVWGAEAFRPVGRMGHTLQDVPGSLRVVADVGFSSVPDDVKLACCLAVSAMMSRRKLGAPVNSESLNGYSYSTSGQFTATSFVTAPDVMQLLIPYGAGRIHIG